MTYEEVRARLTKCEVKLKELQADNSPARKSKNYEVAVEKLTFLKESLEKQLAEQEETMLVKTKGGDTAIVGMDRKQAKDLRQDPTVTSIKTSKGMKIKEQDGVEFSTEETAAISKEVGKALAMALRGAGDEVDSMKVKNIEPNSFEIYVVYKNEVDDQFSFYISEDTLHLVDFSFDKELTDVGVKPSGEPVVHVDVLANELTKHFKSLQETMSDEEYADAKEADRLEKHPEKDKIEKIKALIAAQTKDESIFDTPRMGGFHNSKGVAGHISNTHKQDQEYAASNRKAYKKDDDEEVNEAPEGRYYIKVAVRDARKALTLLDDSPAYSSAMELDGSDTYYFDDEQLAYDAMMDLSAHGIEITDNNIDLDENKAHDEGGDLDIGHQDDEPDMLKQNVYDIATYAAKLYKILDRYDQMDGEVDFPHWWQKKVILARDYISAAQHYLEFEEKQPAIDALALEEGVDEASHAKLKREYDELVGKMKQLAQHFKTAEGEKKAKVVAALKQHTARKRELESQLDNAIAGIGVSQELSEQKATCCGKCGRVHVKGTECKRPFLKGKDHCRYN